jgi:chloramphenicol-sensitive protein RarD
MLPAGFIPETKFTRRMHLGRRVNQNSFRQSKKIMLQPDLSLRSESLLGAVYAGAAFLIWGLMPVYWKALGAVPSLEITFHRMVWSFGFLLLLIGLQKRWTEFSEILKDRRTLWLLFLSALLLGGNWWLYIWAINADHLLQASLGYYINPLINVALGVIFLKERLRPPQILAVLLAAGAVLYLTFYYGQLPWIALLLALTFGFYGLIRKIAPVGSLTGLAVETLLLSVPAVVYLIHLAGKGVGSLFRSGFKIDLLLIGCGPVTAVPLLFFILGARKIHLSTLGLMQYIGPSGMFLLAVLVYHEPFSIAQMWTFIMIWAALIIYSTDSVRNYRRYAR